MISARFAIVIALALLGATSKPAPALPQAPVSGTFGVWTVHMTQVDYNNATGNFSTPNHVTMTRNGGDVSADRASGNAQRQVATLSGNVVVHDVQGAFSSSASNGPSRGPATLTTDTLQIDGAAKTYVALGNVHYTQADTDVTAKKGTLDDAAHVLYLEGSVHVRQGGRSLVAEHVRYNVVTGDAHAEGSNVILQFPGAEPAIATPRPLHLPKLPGGTHTL